MTSNPYSGLDSDGNWIDPAQARFDDIAFERQLESAIRWAEQVIYANPAEYQTTREEWQSLRQWPEDDEPNTNWEIERNWDRDRLRRIEEFGREEA